MSGLLGRADLLACLRDYGETDLARLASALGYQTRKAEAERDSKVMHVLDATASTSLDAPAITRQIDAGEARALFFRVVSHRRLAPEESVRGEPEWYRLAQPFEPDAHELRAPTKREPPPPLMPWSRLWPFLKLALGAAVASHRPDLRRAVERIARGESLRRVPRASRQGWAGDSQLIIDFAAPLLPFWADFDDLRTRLMRLRGRTGLTILAFPDGDPTGCCWRHTRNGWRTFQHYRPPPPGTPVLVLSDLGCNEIADHRRLRWRRFGLQLLRTGCRSVALMPSPARWWEGALACFFFPVCWDRDGRPPRRVSRPVGRLAPMTVARDSRLAETLLTLLAPAVRVEPGLLRAARYLFPARQMDVGVEFAAWNHAAVQATPLAFYFDRASIASYRDRFREAATLSPEQKRRAAALVDSHHRHLSPVIRYEEQLIRADLMGEPPPEAAKSFAARLAKTIGAGDGAIAEAGRDWVGRMAGRQHPSLWRNETLAGVWGVAHAEALRRSRVLSLPEGLTLERVAWALGSSGSEASCQLRQLGLTLVIATGGSVIRGSLVTEMRFRAPFLQVENFPTDGLGQQCRLFPIDGQVPLPVGNRLRIRTDREVVELDNIRRPEWASAIGRDESGLYTELSLAGAVQRFRWIAPGTFLMGSPLGEPGRFENEAQHEVTLTRGHWLADTACTQALWRAVMGDNPSRFQEDEINPVEMVSWDEIQGFIERINEKVPGLNGRLPTEAEWEYACRAGTKTPFSFGDNITPEQVNYDGNYPYAGGKKGLYREKTAPVKSLPPNAWGLYQMHGNVWEWCADRYGDYPSEPVTDPRGPDKGSGRVMRGGSWYNDGGFVRSAYRDQCGLSDRYDNLGFRLALGPGASGTDGQHDPGAAAGRTAAAERGGQAGRGSPGGKAPRQR